MPTKENFSNKEVLSFKAVKVEKIEKINNIINTIGINLYQ